MPNRTTLDIGRRHPYYKRMEGFWRFYWDTYLGPEYYIKHMANDDRKKTYLFPFPGELEVKGSLSDRNNRSYFVSNTKRAVNRITKFMFGNANKPHRIHDEMFDSYIENCDLQFTHRDQYMSREVIQSLMVGTSLTLINRTSLNTVETSLDQEILQNKINNFTLFDAFLNGIRSFWVPISIFDRLDWKIENGVYEYAIIRSKVDISTPWDENGISRFKHRYFVLTPDVFYEYEAKDNDMFQATLVNEFENELGVIPLVDFTPFDVNIDDIPDIYGADLAHIDRKIYNEWSQMDKAKLATDFPMLAFKNLQDKQKAELLVSPQTILNYTDEIPGYVEPSGTNIERHMAIIDKLLDDFDRVSGTNRQDVDMQVAESGKAKIVDFQDENALLAYLSAQAEEYETQLSRITLIQDGFDPDEIQIEYTHDYNVASDSTKVAFLKELKALYSDDPEKRLLANVMGYSLFKDLPDDFRQELEGQMVADLLKLQELKNAPPPPQLPPAPPNDEQPELFDSQVEVA